MVKEVNQQIIPVSFFKTITEDEWMQVFENEGFLTPALRERAWRHMERTGPAPQQMEILVNRADFDRWMNSKYGKKRRKRR